MAEPNPKSEIRNPKSGGVVVPHKAKWHQRLRGGSIGLFIRAVTVTVRFRLDDRSGPFSGAPGEKFIFAVWHNRLALCLMLYRRYAIRSEPDRRMAAIVSASRDGGLLARILEHFDVAAGARFVQPARRAGVARNGDMGGTRLRPGHHARRPARSVLRVQEGVISTAQLTGLPIVPASYHLNWKIRLKSWDRFQVPLPFARCEVIDRQGHARAARSNGRRTRIAAATA